MLNEAQRQDHYQHTSMLLVHGSESVQVFRRLDDAPSTHADGRRRKSAKAGNRGRWSTRRSAKAKYRDPKTKEAWSGRGRMASWLKRKQEAGEKIDKYLV